MRAMPYLHAWLMAGIRPRGHLAPVAAVKTRVASAVRPIPPVLPRAAAVLAGSGVATRLCMHVDDTRTARVTRVSYRLSASTPC
jgi:hypothetical protein